MTFTTNLFKFFPNQRKTKYTKSKINNQNIEEKPSILIIGSRLHSDGYPRNQEIIKILDKSGYDLCWCALPYPTFFHHLRLPLRLAFIIAYTPFRWLYAFSVSAYHYINTPISYIYAPFPAHLDLPLAYLTARMHGTQLVADVFLSVYNTLVQDRQIFKDKSIAARLIYNIERFLLKLPNISLIDTEEHQILLEKLFDHSDIYFKVVPITIDEQLFRFVKPSSSNKVIFWGTYIRLHGVKTIIKAASLVQQTAPHIRFEMIGKGQELSFAKILADQLNVRNIDFIEQILPATELIKHARSAFCTLGIFGSSEKAASVLPYKAVQSLALGIPLITAETPASSRLLFHKQNALLVPPNDANALSNSIMYLHSNHKLCTSLAKNGRRTFEEKFSQKHINFILNEVFHD